MSHRPYLGVTLVALLAVPTLVGCSGSNSASRSESVVATTTQPGESTSIAEQEVDQSADAQACLDAWNSEKNNPALASFLLASGGRRGLKRVSVGFAKGDACLISFAGTNGFVVQVIEVNPPSGQFTGLFPPGRLDKFDPSPVGWNAIANRSGWLTLHRSGVSADPPTVPATETAGFPSPSEEEVLADTPFGDSQCERSQERTQGASAGVICEPVPHISVRYERFNSLADLDTAYWSYFMRSVQRKAVPGANCVRGEIGEGWITYQGESGGRLFCSENEKRRPELMWEHDDALLLAFAVGERRDALVRWWREGGGWIG